MMQGDNKSQSFEFLINSDSFDLPLSLGYDYNFIVNWGDGNTNHITSYNQSEKSHTYSNEGDYIISISGTCESISFENNSEKLKIKNIIQWGNIGLRNMQFQGCSNLVITATDLLDTSNMISMRKTFDHCSSITTIPRCDEWDVSNVTDMDYMFYYALLFNQPIGNWNVSNVTSMSYMFTYAGNFNQPIGNWNISGVTNLWYTFHSAIAFNQPLNNWDVSNVTSFHRTFYGAKAFNQPLNNWDVSNVTDFSYMFYDADGFVNGSISNWDVGSATTLERMFQRSKFNQPLNWNTANVQNMKLMFYADTNFEQNIGNLNITNLLYANDMFYGVTLDTTNYDALLIGWEAQAVQDNVEFNAGNSKYTLGGDAETARNNLINNHGWTITDYGGI